MKALHKVTRCPDPPIFVLKMFDIKKPDTRLDAQERRIS